MSSNGLPSTTRELDEWLRQNPEPAEVVRLIDHLSTEKLRRQLLRQTSVGGRALAERVVASYPDLAYLLAYNSEFKTVQGFLVRTAARWIGEGGQQKDRSTIQQGLRLAEAILDNDPRLERDEELHLFVAGYGWPDEIRAEDELRNRLNNLIDHLVITSSPSRLAGAACQLPPRRGQELIEAIIGFDPFPVMEFFEGRSREELEEVDPEILLPILQDPNPELRKRILRVLKRMDASLPEKTQPSR